MVYVDNLLKHYTITWKVKPLSHQSGVLTVFPQHLKKNEECRGASCAVASNAVCALSERLECVTVAFVNKRRGLTFAQHVRQRAVETLSQHCKFCICCCCFGLYCFCFCCFCFYYCCCCCFTTTVIAVVYAVTAKKLLFILLLKMLLLSYLLL